MAAPERRCSSSSGACVRRCRKATSRAKRRRLTQRSPRSRGDTGRNRALSLPLRRPRRRRPQPRRQPESRAPRPPRRRRSPRRPRPLRPPPPSAPARLRRPRHQPHQLDRLPRRGRQAHPGRPRARLFRPPLRSDLSRPRKGGPSRLRARRRKRRPRLPASPPQSRRRPRLRRLDPSWLLRWAVRLAAEPPPRLWPGAAGTRVCRG